MRPAGCDSRAACEKSTSAMPTSAPCVSSSTAAGAGPAFEEEAIALANSTAYGLAGMCYTSDAARAERVGFAVRAGTVWINCFLIRDLTAPFGGTGISGIGREGGDFALDFHSDLKTLQILQDSVS